MRWTGSWRGCSPSASARCSPPLLTAVGASGGQPAPIAAVSGAFIDRTPAWLKDFAIATFGTNDKRALLVGTVVVLALVCAAIGVLARRRLTLALVLFAVVGAVGAAAVLSRPGASPADIVPTLLGVAAGLWFLSRAHAANSVATPSNPTRRWVIGGLVGGAAAYVGSLLGGGSTAATASRDALKAQTLKGTTLTIPAGADLGIEGLTPYIVPNEDFYRIDTAIVVPRLDAAEWRLKVTGMVDREVEIDWKTLQSKQMQEALVTLMCVSNEVGGDLTGNAVWTGWPVRELLAMAGPKAGADMVLQTSADGWTCGTPLGALTDDRNALLAIRMNGEPLPFEHGFPVRLVVPGLYGYVSATKWVTELKVTTFEQDQGYWTPRGWSPLGPGQDELAHRRAAGGCLGQGRTGRRRRRRVGAAPGHLQGRGPGRPGAVDPGAARRRREHRHVAPVGARLGRHPREPRHPRAGLRRQRRGAVSLRGAARSRRRDRHPRGQRPGGLTTASASISTSSSGSMRATTCTIVDAGRTSPKTSPCARPTSAQCAMSVT